MHNEPDALPTARYLSIAWEIPVDFAGMTSAFLRRNRAFERLGGRAVDVVTFDARPHYPELERSLRERGLLTSAAKIINIWDWLREHSVGGFDHSAIPATFEPLDARPDYPTTERDGVVLTRARQTTAGELLQLDHYRADGSLLASDRRDAPRRGTPRGRSIVLCDADGRPVRSWRTAGAFYRDWLDLLRAGETAVMIIDSKTAARFMVGYRRPGVTTVHVLHGSHLGDGGRGLRESRRKVFTRLREFDAVVTLTETQKRDIEARMPRAHNLVCIPNSVDAPPVPQHAGEPRDPAAVAVVASLIPRKRVSSAIRAVAAVRASGYAAVHLDIYGDGPQRPKLEGLVGRLDAGGFVDFKGHVAGADRVLERASMLLLTSHSEGFGLVLLEAMARGCIPIAYDVPYGPSDIIRDGVNGFLVPGGDIEGLAAKIRDVLAMAPPALARMRASGRETAVGFSDDVVLRKWVAALQEAHAASAGRHGPGHLARVQRLLRLLSS